MLQTLILGLFASITEFLFDRAQKDLTMQLLHRQCVELEATLKSYFQFHREQTERQEARIKRLEQQLQEARHEVSESNIYALKTRIQHLESISQVPQLSEDEKGFLKEKMGVEAIKAYRDRVGVSLVQAKAAIDLYRTVHPH